MKLVEERGPRHQTVNIAGLSPRRARPGLGGAAILAAGTPEQEDPMVGAEIEAARLLTRHAAFILDESTPNAAEASMATAARTKVALR